MKYLAPIPKQFVDHNGLPLSNGKVHVYISGDTQYANVYQDADGEELMPNPASLDSSGAWLGFVTAGVPLDYVVEDKDGNVQFEYEKVVAGGGTANVAIEPTLTSGTKIAECWVDGELLELFAPEGGGGGQSLSASLPLKIEGGIITNNGTNLTCTGDNAWAEGKSNEASGEHSHAEGSETIASGANTHAEGAATKATHPHAHAEGFHTEATATSAHAEGSGAKATTTTAHAEGQDTVASGDASHAQGRNSVASGAYSHASGYGTRATGQGSHAVGKYNDDGSALFVVGNGSGPNNRKDVFKVDSNEDTWVTIGGVLTKVTNVSGGGGGGSVGGITAKMIDSEVGIKVVDENGYVGATLTDYFPHIGNTYYNNYAIVVEGADFSQSGLGRVAFITPGSADIGGRTYRTVNIGGVEWLAENLDYKFSGCNIGGSGTPYTPNAWYYNNDEATYGIDGTRKCGLLYNWYAVKLLNDNRATLCPGWHVPTNDEWTALANAVGGTSTAGTRLKAIDGAADGSWPTGWNGTDDYGFAALPAGYYNGSFNGVGSYDNFWAITESGSGAYSRGFGTGATMYQNTDRKDRGDSVRLVKDS